MKAIIELDVPEWQIGQDVSVYFPDTMCKRGKCKADEIVRCKNCKHRDPEDFKCDCGHDIHWELPRPDDWFCADGERT